jgi:hypothetical protein
MRSKNHATRLRLKELSKRVRLLVRFNTAKKDDGSYKERTFASDGVFITLDKAGTITTKVDHPIMLLLDPNYGLTPIHVVRADGYQPLAKTNHLETALSILRELPPPEDD